MRRQFLPESGCSPVYSDGLFDIQRTHGRHAALTEPLCHHNLSGGSGLLTWTRDPDNNSAREMPDVVLR